MMSSGDEHEVPGGLLRVPKDLTREEVQEVIERFRDAMSVEKAAGRAYVAFCRKRYGADGVGWDMLSDLERETWRDVVKAVLDAE
jgi:hypothetical protein